MFNIEYTLKGELEPGGHELTIDTERPKYQGQWWGSHWERAGKSSLWGLGCVGRIPESRTGCSQKAGACAWGLGIGICTLWCMLWMVNRDLLYSTGNSTQYSAIPCIKESEKEWVSLYVELHHFVTQQELSQPCKSTILQ